MVETDRQPLHLTACRFDPDTVEAATAYGEKGIRDGSIKSFRVVTRFDGRQLLRF